MKKLLLLCVLLIFSCGEKDQRKSWLEQWGYKGNMKSSEYTTYYASMEFGEIKKGSVISESFEGIDEWIFPYSKTKYNLYGDREEDCIDKTLLFKNSFVYKNNELSYKLLEDGTEMKAINDQRYKREL